MNKEEILKAVDELVSLARASKAAELDAYNCGHNQDYIKMHKAQETYKVAYETFVFLLKDMK